MIVIRTVQLLLYEPAQSCIIIMAVGLNVQGTPLLKKSCCQSQHSTINAVLIMFSINIYYCIDSIQYAIVTIQMELRLVVTRNRFLYILKLPHSQAFPFVLLIYWLQRGGLRMRLVMFTLYAG